MHSSVESLDLTVPEASFRLPAGCQLSLAADDESMVQHLRRRVAAAPGDLLAHTRRIVLAHRREDGNELLGALIDLFIATGPKGRELRRRLLRRSAPLLAPDSRRLLERCLESGLSGGGQVNCPGSVLAQATTGLKVVTWVPG